MFVHPSIDDVTLTGLLSALGDPLRLCIIQNLIEAGGSLSCSEATPCPSVAKSTLSHHFRILREAGLIHTVKEGVEHRNTLRCEEINAKFPGLINTVMGLAQEHQ